MATLRSLGFYLPDLKCTDCLTNTRNPCLPEKSGCGGGCGCGGGRLLRQQMVSN